MNTQTIAWLGAQYVYNLAQIAGNQTSVVEYRQGICRGYAEAIAIGLGFRFYTDPFQRAVEAIEDTLQSTAYTGQLRLTDTQVKELRATARKAAKGASKPFALY
jgi:hypothetical protein